jgi:hypothetical protein
MRWHDVFHPTMFFMPQLLFFYVAFPVYGLSVDELTFVSRGGGWDSLVRFQLIADIMCVALIIGIWWGCHASRAKTRGWYDLDSDAIFSIAIIFGTAGLLAWIAGIINVGGFYEAYGSAYGGGWDDSGYVREAGKLGFVATPLLVLSYRKSGMNLRRWMLVLLFLAPVLVQGFLGARRGPTFLALTGIAGSYILVFRPRIPFVALCAGALCVGFLLLFLVANRGNIYLGSQKDFDNSATMMMKNWSGNEYLFSSAIVRYVEGSDDVPYGRRILAHTAVRVVPSAIWPTKYADISRAMGLNLDLTKMAGIPAERIATFTGWDIADGAAPSIVGDFWLEFGLLSPFAAIGLGWFYGRLWRLSRSDPRMQPVYVMLAALSIYLVAQTIEAWVFRALLYGIPAFMAMRWLGRKRPARAGHHRHAMRSAAYQRQ